MRTESEQTTSKRPSQRLRPIYFLPIVVPILLSLAVLLPLFGASDSAHSTGSTNTQTANHAPDQTMAIALNGPTTLSAMQLTTNFYNATEVQIGMMAQKGQTTGYLQQWSPPMVRLHMGFTGNPPSLPEDRQGVWDFRTLDAAISQLRANHISFYLNVRNGPSWMFDNQGQLRDPSFQEFARYMVDLVNWYNHGGFTDENGVYHQSGHVNWVHAWEIWNEPNSGYEIPAPVPNPSATWMYAPQFAQLYSTVSDAMRAADPTIITGGPALSAYPNDEYLHQFIIHVTAPLDFLAFHFYAIGTNTATDQAAFDEINGHFQTRLRYVRSILDQTFPGKHVPIWVDEVGYNESARAPVDPRGTAPVGYAWLGATFAMAEAQHVALFAQFIFLGNAQLALINNQTLQPYVTYWIYRLLAEKFPPGSLLLPISMTGAGGIVGLAAMAPDHHTLRVVLANTAVAHSADVNGNGAPRMVAIRLQGAFQTLTPQAGKQATVWNFDATTSRAAMPTPGTQATQAGSSGAVTLQTTLAGYGVTVIELPL